jgi:hypothetical protein
VEVLVAHGGIIKFILFLLLHRKAGRIPHPEEWHLFMETTKIRNSSVSIVGQTAQGEWRIFMLNNAEFMPRFPGDLKDPRGAETEPVVSEMRDGPAMGIADLMDWLRRQREEAEGRWAPRLDAVLPDGDRLRLLSQHLSIQTPAASCGEILPPGPPSHPHSESPNFGLYLALSRPTRRSIVQPS